MKNIKNKIAAISTSALVFVMMPLVSEARGLTDFLNTVNGWLTKLVPMMITLGIIAFFWGLVKYLFGEGSEGKGEGLKIMMYGILAVFVMASIGGIVKLLQDTTNTGGNNQITGPCVGVGCGRVR